MTSNPTAPRLPKRDMLLAAEHLKQAMQATNSPNDYMNMAAFLLGHVYAAMQLGGATTSEIANFKHSVDLLTEELKQEAMKDIKAQGMEDQLKLEWSLRKKETN